MKRSSFFSLFTTLLILGLIAIFALPHTQSVVAQIPGFNFSVGSKTPKPKSTNPTTKAPSTTPTDTPAQTPSTTEADDRAASMYSVSLPILIGVHIARTSVPITSASLWNEFVATLSDDYRDPYTNEFPVYTTQTPKVGQIQLISPGECNPDTGTLEPSTITKTYAYRVVVGDKFLCHYNLGGSVYSR